MAVFSARLRGTQQAIPVAGPLASTDRMRWPKYLLADIETSTSIAIGYCPTPNVLTFSIHDRPFVPQTVYALGADGFLMKPVAADSLHGRP
jgi:DNA-binding NarL/FixJ family response regulator